jgi:hypothetical protein
MKVFIIDLLAGQMIHQVHRTADWGCPVNPMLPGFPIG